MTPHEPATLVILSDFTRQGGRGQRRWAVWYRHLECPTCKRRFVRMTNPLRGRQVRCVGSDRLQVRAKGQGSR